MDNPIPELDKIRRQLMILERPKKPKILVVDDEPDNLDLLYRTFRRDFNVFKAESGIHALDVLAAEGEVAVIISDQRMPEMKGTEFLRKTLPQFPDTVRIILTGFTDIEDLVEAINSGQVYKYITKPWDPDELKQVVQKATETHYLLKQRTEELQRANAQIALLSLLVEVAQEGKDLEATLNQISRIFGEGFAVDTCILQLVENNSLIPSQGIYSSHGNTENWLAKDPLIKEAIATQQIQVAANISKDKNLATFAHYNNNNIRGHLSIPILLAGKVLAILSLQWEQPYTLREDEVKLIHLSAQLLTVVLTHSQNFQLVHS
ncbi:MAG: response regulator [Nostocaceae cyanobacterium]|nr:response regulator [Nostocaceae cyanobacterium]